MISPSIRYVMEELHTSTRMYRSLPLTEAPIIPFPFTAGKPRASHRNPEVLSPVPIGKNLIDTQSQIVRCLRRNQCQFIHTIFSIVDASFRPLSPSVPFSGVPGHFTGNPVLPSPRPFFCSGWIMNLIPFLEKNSTLMPRIPAFSLTRNRLHLLLSF